jgi:hypothetical protein
MVDPPFGLSSLMTAAAGPSAHPLCQLDPLGAADITELVGVPARRTSTNQRTRYSPEHKGAGGHRYDPDYRKIGKHGGHGRPGEVLMPAPG